MTRILGWSGRTTFLNLFAQSLLPLPDQRCFRVRHGVQLGKYCRIVLDHLLKACLCVCFIEDSTSVPGNVLENADDRVVLHGVVEECEIGVVSNRDQIGKT